MEGKLIHQYMDLIDGTCLVCGAEVTWIPWLGKHLECCSCPVCCPEPESIKKEDFMNIKEGAQNLLDRLRGRPRNAVLVRLSVEASEFNSGMKQLVEAIKKFELSIKKLISQEAESRTTVKKIAKKLRLLPEAKYRRRVTRPMAHRRRNRVMGC